LRLNRLLQTVQKPEKPELTTTDLLSPLADVKADICDLPLRITNTILFFVITFWNTFQMTLRRWLYRVLKPGGMAILQIPQDLSRATTFADDSITDQKERSEIFSIRSRPYLWTRLF
jgi:hypothetical protein